MEVEDSEEVGEAEDAVPEVALPEIEEDTVPDAHAVVKSAMTRIRDIRERNFSICSVLSKGG